MNKLIAGLAVAAATVAATAAVSVPTAADAQPYGRHFDGPRYWHGPARGDGYHSWRRGYYGAYNRYPARVCRVRYHRTVCYYR